MLNPENAPPCPEGLEVEWIKDPIAPSGYRVEIDFRREGRAIFTMQTGEGFVNFPSGKGQLRDGGEAQGYVSRVIDVAKGISLARKLEILDYYRWFLNQVFKVGRLPEGLLTTQNVYHREGVHTYLLTISSRERVILDVRPGKVAIEASSVPSKEFTDLESATEAFDSWRDKLPFEGYARGLMVRQYLLGAFERAFSGTSAVETEAPAEDILQHIIWTKNEVLGNRELCNRIGGRFPQFRLSLPSEKETELIFSYGDREVRVGVKSAKKGLLQEGFEGYGISKVDSKALSRYVQLHLQNSNSLETEPMRKFRASDDMPPTLSMSEAPDVSASPEPEAPKVTEEDVHLTQLQKQYPAPNYLITQEESGNYTIFQKIATAKVKAVVTSWKRE